VTRSELAGDGMPITSPPANRKIGEREVLAATLDRDTHLIRAGQVTLADNGFTGRELAAHLTGHHARLLRPDRRDEAPRHARWRVARSSRSRSAAGFGGHHVALTLVGSPSPTEITGSR
jgi:hypothetical protein